MNTTRETGFNKLLFMIHDPSVLLLDILCISTLTSIHSLSSNSFFLRPSNRFLSQTVELTLSLPLYCTYYHLSPIVVLHCHLMKPM
jgi:hypothetical protein